MNLGTQQAIAQLRYHAQMSTHLEACPSELARYSFQEGGLPRRRRPQQQCEAPRFYGPAQAIENADPLLGAPQNPQPLQQTLQESGKTQAEP